MIWLCKRLFDDKRCTIALLLVWMVTVCSIFYMLGAFHMAYMHMGGSKRASPPRYLQTLAHRNYEYTHTPHTHTHTHTHTGPGENTVFMGLKINSWGKWTALAVFSFFNTCINEFISNALDPWFLNSLQVICFCAIDQLLMRGDLTGSQNTQDHKTRSIEYSHVTCLWIVQIHCMYVHVMGVFSLFLFFSQVDFAIIRLLADWLVTGYSTVWFIQVIAP